MKRIYKGQTKLRLVINTKCNLTDWKEVFLHFRKPNGITGSFRAQVADAEEGIIFYDVTENNELDLAGFWFFWPSIVFADDRITFGRAAKVFVYEAGE